MAPSRQYPPPSKGPGIDDQLKRLYQRKRLLANLIRSLEAYARAGRFCAANGRKKPV
ncbi:MAG: hypothetical protein IT159_04755 [Bryobacterales bacterium]|mgnify:CR=1 FL=1|nr:hypothetical protein [Bryobacterales bacterium]